MSSVFEGQEEFAEARKREVLPLSVKKSIRAAHLKRLKEGRNVRRITVARGTLINEAVTEDR